MMKPYLVKHKDGQFIFCDTANRTLKQVREELKGRHGDRFLSVKPHKGETSENRSA